jgi:hypothetical protein
MRELSTVGYYIKRRVKGEAVSQGLATHQVYYFIHVVLACCRCVHVLNDTRIYRACQHINHCSFIQYLRHSYIYTRIGYGVPYHHGTQAMAAWTARVATRRTYVTCREVGATRARSLERSRLRRNVQYVRFVLSLQKRLNVRYGQAGGRPPVAVRVYVCTNSHPKLGVRSFSLLQAVYRMYTRKYVSKYQYVTTLSYAQLC